MAGYCTLGEARAAGAVGADAAVQSAVDAASDLVDRYTGDVFSPRTLTVNASVDAEGGVTLGLRVRSITSITTDDNVTAIPGWTFSASSQRGAVDRVQLPSVGWSNVLINGYEPYNPDRLNRTYGRVLVTGSFGWDTVPTAVELATAHLAALLARPLIGEASAQVSDPEGNVIPAWPSQDSTDAVEPSLLRTTGSRKADLLLQPFKRVRLRAA